MILSIPYKPLSRCSIDELAAQQAWANRRRVSGGVAFARGFEDRSEKAAARDAILQMLTLAQRPGHLSVLTMPGLDWSFEAQLLKQREPNWRLQQTVDSMRLTCVENDRFIYYSAATKMPGNKHSLIRSLARPEFAEQAVGNGMVDRFAFANVDDLMQDKAESFDVAWLDYTGPLSVDRVKLIREFWQRGVRDVLVVTSLKARWNRRTSDTIARHGGCLNWLRHCLPGHVLHEIEYQDSASPMVQFAVRKVQQ